MKNWYRTHVASGFPREVEVMLSGASFAMLSAEDGRLNATPQGRAENNRRDAELKTLLEQQGIGFVVNHGLWSDTELKTSLPEKSLFVTNVSEAMVQKLCKRFAQQAYIYGEKGQFALKGQDGNVMMQGKVADYFQQLPSDAKTDFTETNGRKWSLTPPQQEVA